ncbi:MAG: hypothetical protein M1269_02960 [Chloroflexi bacterium]|nr:hypothetical protein [Chloroflexota bacterium]
MKKKIIYAAIPAVCLLIIGVIGFSPRIAGRWRSTIEQRKSAVFSKINIIGERTTQEEINEIVAEMQWLKPRLTLLNGRSETEKFEKAVFTGMSGKLALCGRSEDAPALLRNYVKKFPTSEIQGLFGMMLGHNVQGKDLAAVKEAEAMAKAGVRLDPDNPECWSYLFDVQVRFQDPKKNDEIKRNLMPLLARFPENYDLHRLYADVLSNEGNYAESARQRLIAIKLMPESGEYYHFNVAYQYCLLAPAYLNCHEDALAQEAAKEALKHLSLDKVSDKKTKDEIRIPVEKLLRTKF